MLYKLLFSGIFGLIGFFAQAEHACIHGEIKTWSTYQDPEIIKVPYSVSKHRFYEQQTNWAPIRLVFVFDPGNCSSGTCGHCETVGQVITTFSGSTTTCRAEDILTTSKKNYIMNTLLSNAQTWFQSVLQVVPVSGNLIISGSFCGPTPGAVVPASHSSTGVPNADMVVYVTAAPASDPASLVVGWASPCRLDSNSRPVAAQVNFIPASLSNADILDSWDTQQDTDVALHELTHALGFSAPFFGSQGYLDRNGVFQSGGTITVSERGHSVSKINSPRVLDAARNYFNCPTLNGLEIEDQGGTGTLGTHWEKRVMVPELMTGILTTPRTYYSNMTLAFLEDTGHYKSDYSKAAPMTWGKSKGCDFVLLSCNSTQVRNLGEWCWQQNSALQFCNQDFLAGGFCDIASYSSALPANEEYFNNLNLGGGTALADYCPYVTMYSNRVCIDPSGADSQNIYGSTYGNSSRCFDSNLVKTSFSVNSQGARCFAYTCTSTGSLLLNIQGVTVQCPTDGSAGAADMTPISANYHGYINCPAAQNFCSLSTPAPTTSSTTPTSTIPTSQGPTSAPTHNPVSPGPATLPPVSSASVLQSGRILWGAMLSLVAVALF